MVFRDFLSSTFKQPKDENLFEQLEEKLNSVAKRRTLQNVKLASHLWLFILYGDGECEEKVDREEAQKRLDFVNRLFEWSIQPEVALREEFPKHWSNDLSVIIHDFESMRNLLVRSVESSKRQQ